MAKSSITEVSANNTFQVWLDKTNELVDLVKSDILTASLASANGDITIGNATLHGDFTANTVIADDLLRVDSISPKSGSTSISVSAPVNITTNQTVLSRFTSAIGSRLSFFNDSDTDWQIGFENNTTKKFIISNGAGFFRLDSSGNVEIAGILSGTASVASVASTVTLTPTNTTNATHFPVFVDTATGNEQVRTDTGFTYNPSTGTLQTVTVSATGYLYSNTQIGVYNNTAGPLSIINTTVANGNDAEFWIQKSRNGGVITAGDDIGTIDFQGHNGTQFVSAAKIFVDSTANTGNLGGVMRFYNNGSQSLVLEANNNITASGVISAAGIDTTGQASVTSTLTIKNAGQLVLNYSGVTTAGEAASTWNIDASETNNTFRIFNRNASNVANTAMVIPETGAISFGRDLSAPNISISGVVTIKGDVPQILFNDTSSGTVTYTNYVNNNQWILKNNNTTDIVLRVEQSGNLIATGNVTAYSDERLKTNIRTIDSALDKVTSMRGVYFDKDGKAGIGVIAQEVEKVLPEVVIEGEYKSVAYGNIVGLLIEAIKELKAELDELKNKGS